MSYITERYQITKCYGVALGKCKTEYGIPQGTRLSSVLFLIYINDVIDSLKFCQIGLSADDTLFYISSSDPVKAVQLMIKDLSRIQNWLNVKLNL